MIIILLTRKITRLQIENKNRTPKNKEESHKKRLLFSWEKSSCWWLNIFGFPENNNVNNRK